VKIDTHNPTALGLTVTGALLLLGTLIANFVVKAPDPRKAVAPTVASISKSKQNAKKTYEQANAQMAGVQARLWDVSDDKIAPEALKRLNAMAKKHGLALSTFRANQKEQSAGALNILPLFVTLDGPFPGVGDFVKDFEENEPLLTLSMFQIASTDQTTHKVTASLGINAYIDPNRQTTPSADVVVKTKTPPVPASAGKPAPARTGTAPAVPAGASGRKKV